MKEHDERTVRIAGISLMARLDVIEGVNRAALNSRFCDQLKSAADSYLGEEAKRHKEEAPIRRHELSRVVQQGRCIAIVPSFLPMLASNPPTDRSKIRLIRRAI